jgi:ADP-heptose:LPS heptosyltransferase
MAYPLINQSDAIGCHFMEAYCRYLGEQLGVPLPLAVNKPTLYLSDQERSWTTQIAETIGKHIPYWVINAGHKLDFTAKWWGTRNFQEVVDGLRGKVTFVQIGELGPNHNHPPLQGVIDLRGKTTTRQLLRLVYHAVGGVGPSTLLQHVCAAFDKPYVLIAGGREPRAWQQYPLQTTLSAVGTLNCCATRACWKSRTIKLNDGDEKDQSLCDRPMLQQDGGFIPLCLEQITPTTVIQAISGYRRVALY